MSEIYTIAIVILAILAISGLYVGVTNDAVNFLNSAIGSKVAPRRCSSHGLFPPFLSQSRCSA